MSDIILSSWNYILAALALLAAFITAYFTGKKIGVSKAEAKAEVKAAQVESSQVSAVAEKQKENTQVAQNAQSSNASISDADARRKLQQSKYNAKD
ncbi:hypothetical protein JNO12_12815 [Erwinia aphidicola]|nr:hypothetical protein [Erwinia aphidicola]